MEITESGYIATMASRAFVMHGHERECEFHLFMRGAGHFMNAGNRLPFRAPALVYSSPGEEHACDAGSPDLETAFYFVRFVPDKETRAVLRDAHGVLPCERARPSAGRFLHVFEDIRAKTNGGGPLARRSAEHQLLALLYELASESDPRPFRPWHPSVERLIRTMQERIYGTLSIEEFARDDGITKEHLCRRFKACTGLTALQYYHRLKIESARHLLEHTSDPVYMIAQRLCFWDEFHFSKVFKRYMGVSPGNYRRESR